MNVCRLDQTHLGAPERPCRASAVPWCLNEKNGVQAIVLVREREKGHEVTVMSVVEGRGVLPRVLQHARCRHQLPRACY